MVAIAIAIAFAIGAVADGSTPGALESKIGSSRSKEGQVRAGIHSDSARIAGFQGNIDDLQTRLSALESSLSVERNLLDSIRSQLSVARTQLAALQVQLVHDRRDEWNQWYHPIAHTRTITAIWHTLAWGFFGGAYVAAIVYVSSGINAKVPAVILVVTAGSRLSQYVGAAVGELGFLRQPGGRR